MSTVSLQLFAIDVPQVPGMELGTGTRLRPGGLQSPDVDGLSSVRWAVLDGMGL